MMVPIKLLRWHLKRKIIKYKFNKWFNGQREGSKND